ncbi:DUF3331 domain-containing protein [Burkholderia anthina]|uniref:DUF3331 domain-containing protein n=1 Tax=Burkholderia anthina TaxID=179879 RepID=UPI0009BEDFD5|nr:DUF3331 domain-containing protein [Burkholderia anthina]
MNIAMKADPWEQTLLLLMGLSGAGDRSNEVRSGDLSKRKLDGTGAAFSVDSVSGALRRKAVVTPIERISDSSVLVSWHDSTSCHYNEQTWVSGFARVTGVCALSGASIRSGAAIYRPGRRAYGYPANAEAMILAEAMRNALGNQDATNSTFTSRK